MEFKKTSEKRIKENRRYTTFTGAEVWCLQRDLRRNIRVLVFFCVVAWALGLLSFCFSEWVHVDPTHDMNLEVHKPSHAHLTVVSCAGGLTFMIGFMGYWGALNLEHVMICNFSYVIFLNGVIGLAFGAVILTIPMEVIEENAMHLVKTQVDEILPIFQIQEFMHCCGAQSPSDWVESKWWKAQRKFGNSLVLPESCCIDPKNFWKCNTGKSPFREVLDNRLIHRKGCADLVLKRKKYLVRASGYGITLCGLVQIVCFFAINILGNIIYKYKHRLDEIREQVPEAAHIRKPPHDPRVEARFERRMSSTCP